MSHPLAHIEIKPCDDPFATRSGQTGSGYLCPASRVDHVPLRTRAPFCGDPTELPWHKFCPSLVCEKRQRASPQKPGGQEMAELGFTLTCPSFIPDGPFSVTHTCDGKNISPPLQWSHQPPETRSFVLIMEDLDAPDGSFTHWVLFDIPGAAASLAEPETSIGIPGRNDAQYAGYTGPCPPPRGGEHRYVLRLYALDVEALGTQCGATRREVEDAMQGHILDHAELMGRYGRS